MNYYDYDNLIDKTSRIIPIKKYRNLIRDIFKKTIKNYYRTEYLINIDNKKNYMKMIL